MTLKEAKQKAIQLSREKRGVKVYIKLSEQPKAFEVSEVRTQTAVYCYRNGSEILL